MCSSDLVIDEPWFRSGAERAKHADLLDGYVGDWIAQRDAAEVIAQFEAAQAAVAPIYTIKEVFEDEQYTALDTITTVEDPDLGPVRMQNVLYRLSETPGAIKWTGRKKGQDSDAVLTELGLSHEAVEQLRTDGIV